MYLLVEILDNTNPRELDVDTPVDITQHGSLQDAIIEAEPENITEEIFVVVSHLGDFGIIPKTNNPTLPSLAHAWKDLDLATLLFKKYEKDNS